MKKQLREEKTYGADGRLVGRITYNKDGNKTYRLSIDDNNVVEEEWWRYDSYGNLMSYESSDGTYKEYDYYE